MHGDRGVNIRFDFIFTIESNKEEVQIPLDHHYVLICILFLFTLAIQCVYMYM